MKRRVHVRDEQLLSENMQFAACKIRAKGKLNLIAVRGFRYTIRKPSEATCTACIIATVRRYEWAIPRTLVRARTMWSGQDAAVQLPSVEIVHPWKSFRYGPILGNVNRMTVFYRGRCVGWINPKTLGFADSKAWATAQVENNPQRTLFNPFGGVFGDPVRTKPRVRGFEDLRCAQGELPFVRPRG